LRAGIEEKESVPAFLVFGNKSEDIISLLLSSCKKKEKNLLTNSWKGGIIVNVAENNTDTTKTIQKQ
jgi:hypothetical protein